jgi:hypothetical protein
MTALYTDPDTGRLISTNSMLKTFLRCPKQAEYKYYRRLKLKVQNRPLTMGKWMHSLYEAHYKGEDWMAVNAKLTVEFSKLFDEEKDALGDLPRACPALMRAYLWHYKEHAWNVLGVEQMIETEFRGKYDMLIEDEYGVWLVDHKNHKRFPNFGFRMLDTQAPRYIWAARKEGIPVQGFIWNYVKTKPMTKPELIQSGKRLSKTTMKNCDFPTALRAIREYELDPEPYKPWLRYLKGQRYKHGEPQTSEFFQRVVLEMPQDQLDRVAVSSFHTSMRMHDYDFSVTDAVERVPMTSCDFMCDYTALCQQELYGGNTDLILRKNYGVGDPMDYYYDDRESAEKDNN